MPEHILGDIMCDKGQDHVDVVGRVHPFFQVSIQIGNDDNCTDQFEIRQGVNQVGRIVVTDKEIGNGFVQHMIGYKRP